MKFKKRISLTIAFVVLVPVWFCIMLGFSGLFDSFSEGRAIKKAAEAFYKAAKSEKLSEFNLQKAIGSAFKAELILYNNDKIVVYSTIPDLKEGYALSDTVVTQLASLLNNKTVLLTSVSDIEQGNAHLLKKLPGYGKYNYNCAIFWESSSFLAMHPTFKIFITGLLTLILLIGIIVSIVTMRFLVRMHNTLKRVSEKYAKGDYSRELPEKGSDDDISIITVLNQMRSRILIDEKQRVHIIMGLSHDFKTPLTLIRAYADLIDRQNTQNDEMISKSTKVINEKVAVLEGMVNEVADYATLEQGDYPIRKKDVNLTDWLLAYVHQSENDASIVGKKLTADIQTPFDTKLKIDETLLGRAMDNMLHNALRYASENGTVKVFSRVADQDFIEFGIEDDGPGIDKKDLPYIFDVFYRADPARKEGNMGIGLSVVKDIIKAHDWDIEVRKAKPHGSIFAIRARRY